MINLESVFSNPILKRSDTLLKVRLWFYGSSLAHLLVVSSLLLTIDFSKEEDPNLRMYQNVRWKLITVWFNLFTAVYFPTCIYCDWRELQGGANSSHVKLMNDLRHLVFNSILLPTTAFGDILFWRIWNKDRNLIAPPGMDEIVPFWTQHCMHTVSLIIILLDLVMVPRQKPKNLIPGIAMLSVFLGTYVFVCVQSFLQGEYIYPGLRNFTGFKFPILVIYVFIENLFYYFSQWLIIEMVWGQGCKKIA